MTHHTLAASLTAFIALQEEIAGFWDGKTAGTVEDNARTATGLIALAQPLLDQLKAIIANED